MLPDEEPRGWKSGSRRRLKRELDNGAPPFLLAVQRLLDRGASGRGHLLVAQPVPPPVACWEPRLEAQTTGAIEVQPGMLPERDVAEETGAVKRASTSWVIATASLEEMPDGAIVVTRMRSGPSLV